MIAPKTSWADEDFELPSAPMGLLPDQPMGASAEYDRNFVRGTGGPRASRDNAPPPPPTIDYARLPTQGPFVCFLGNLPYEVDDNDIRAAFPDVSIINVKIPRDETLRPRGFAYIELADQDSLIKALLLSGAQIKGRYIRFDISEGRQQDRSFASDWRSGVEHQVIERSGRPSFDRPSNAGPERVFDRSMMAPVVAAPRQAPGAWRSTAQPVVAERPKSTSSEVSFKSNAEPKKPVLNLLPRTKPLNEVPEPAAYSDKSKPNPFGGAKPVDKPVQPTA